MNNSISFKNFLKFFKNDLYSQVSPLRPFLFHSSTFLFQRLNLKRIFFSRNFFKEKIILVFDANERRLLLMQENF